MIKKYFIIIASIFSIFLNFFNCAKKTDVELIKERHSEFIQNHKYNNSASLTKKERKDKGLPPNAYYEQEYLNEINPYTGITHKENVFALQKELELNKYKQRVPGDAADNAWVERGPNNIGGRTRAVIFDPNDDSNETVYAGGVSGGLWKNTNISDPTSSWEQVSIPENLAVSCITIDPNNSNIWYVGTGESYTAGDVNGNGVWKTTDGGTTWSNVFGGVKGESVFETNARGTINSSGSLQGEYSLILATDFGGSLNTAITGDLVLADDGVSPNEDGCTALINGTEINGKIAVMRRGDCAFVDKANKAQSAGAIAVIIVNNIAGNPLGQAGSDLNITIPSFMISKDDGNRFIDALSNSNVNITLSKSNFTSGFTISNGIQHVNDIVVRNNNGVSEVYVAGAESFYSDASPSTLFGRNDYGVYKSVNGASFSKVIMPKNPQGNEYEPNNIGIAADNSIYIASTGDTFSEGGGAIFHSTDGVNFILKHTVSDGDRTEIVCSKTNAGTIYVLAQLSSRVGIYKTTDGFETVATLALPSDADTDIPANDFTRGQAYYNLLLRVDPNDENTVYVGGIDLFKSTDGGSSWGQISKWSNNNLLSGLDLSIVHADQHGLAFANSSRMVFSNDGGVYFSNDAGTTISSRNKGYNTLQFYTVGVAPTTAFVGDYFLAGAQDNGSQLFENSDDGVDGSEDISGGDGAHCFFDQDGTDKYFIVNYVYNNSIQLYDFNTGSYRVINQENPSSGNGDFINAEELDSNLDRLYSNYSNDTEFIIVRYSNIKSGTVTKTDLTNDLMDAEPSVLRISPYTTNASNLFVGLKNGKVLLVSRANSFINTWTEITGSDFIGTVSDIEFGANESEIFVTMHNYGVQSIWYTVDAGVTWSAKEGDLPDIPVKTILQNPLNTEEVIVGTELGVWRTSNFSSVNPSWVQSNNGMSNVKVTDLDLRDDNTIFASTYGRGVFSGKFTEAAASVKDVLTDKKPFTIYPTISNGNFTVFAKNTFGKTKVNIFDINGKQVYESNLDFNTNDKQEVSVNLNTGIYMVNLTDENNKKSSSKIIIK